MEKRFTALNILVVLFRILAWVVLVSGVLGAVALLIGALLDGLDALGRYGLPVLTTLGAAVGFIALLFTALMYFVLLQALADVFKVLLAIEENTRALRLAQERQLAYPGTQPTPTYPAASMPYTPPPYYTPPVTPPPAPPQDLPRPQ